MLSVGREVSMKTMVIGCLTYGFPHLQELMVVNYCERAADGGNPTHVTVAIKDAVSEERFTGRHETTMGVRG